jgi:hypothetical protein
MRVRRIFPALHLYPSDSERNLPTGAGMEGLRHKSRHKIAAASFTRCSQEIMRGWGLPFDSGLHVRGHRGLCKTGWGWLQSMLRLPSAFFPSTPSVVAVRRSYAETLRSTKTGEGGDSEQLKNRGMVRFAHSLPKLDS